MSMPQSPGGCDTPAIDLSTGKLHYFAAYEYVFQSGNWLVNLLLATVCQLIPVVGPIVLMGYQYEIVEALHRDPQHVYPDFNFNRFADYLVRGVWPFLVTLVAIMVLVAIMMVPTFLLQFALAASDFNHPGPLEAVVMILMFSIMIAFQFASYLLVLPLALRAGLVQDFAEAFDFVFVRDFVRRMWLEMVFVALFLWVSSLVLMIGGFMLCCLGMFPAMALMQLANAHLWYQLYEIYLLRGGQPIPLKAPASGTVATP